MAVVLALTKGRSSSAVLLCICRQWCAYTLAADIYPHVRVVPSQRNVADDGSRNRSRHLADSDVAEAQVSLWNLSKAWKPTDAAQGKSDNCGGANPTAKDERLIESKPEPKEEGDA